MVAVCCVTCTWFCTSLISVTDTVKPRLAIAFSKASRSEIELSIFVVFGFVPLVLVILSEGKDTLPPPPPAERIDAACASPVAPILIDAGIAAGVGKVANALVIPTAVLTATSKSPKLLCSFSFLPAKDLAIENPEKVNEKRTHKSVCAFRLTLIF